MGAVVHNVGTFVVVVNSARLLRFEPGEASAAPDTDGARDAAAGEGRP